MSGKKVIAFKSLPMRPPISLSILLWLLLDRLNAPVWVWSVVGTLLGIVWIISLHEVFTQELVDLKELAEYPQRLGEPK
jgi:hypothetical protein